MRHHIPYGPLGTELHAVLQGVANTRTFLDHWMAILREKAIDVPYVDGTRGGTAEYAETLVVHSKATRGECVQCLVDMSDIICAGLHKMGATAWTNLETTMEHSSEKVGTYYLTVWFSARRQSDNDVDTA